jgi:bla regulator protein BlaR1
MDFENQLRDELQNAAEKMQPSEQLQMKVATSFRLYRQDKMKRGGPMKKRLIAGLVAVAVFVPTGVFAGPTLVDKIIGTPNEAKEQYGTVESEYQDYNELFEVAKQIFTKEEFEKFTTAWKEFMTINKKKIVVEIDGKKTRTSPASYRLSPEELKKYDEAYYKLEPYLNKIHSKFTFTVDEAKKLMNFPAKHPTYIPEKYQFDTEEVRTEITSGKPKPTINITYKKSNADESQAMAYWTFTIHLSENVKEKLVPFVDNIDSFEGASYDTRTNYTLDGCSVTLGENSNGKIKGMRVIVPAKNGQSSYRMFIPHSTLPKEELEKVLMSMVEK